MSNRDADLATVGRMRRAHAEMVGLSRDGRLADALGDTDPHRVTTYVVKILDVAPGLGKVAGRRLLARLGVPAFARVADLDEQTRAAIVAEAQAQAEAEAEDRADVGGSAPGNHP